MNRATWIVSLLLLAGLGLRLSAGALLHRSGFGQLPDSELYLRYAATVYEGTAYNVDGDGARRAPGYPIFLALCRALLPIEPERAALLVQAVLSTATCGLVWHIARLLEPTMAPAGTAVAALALTAFDPYSIVLSSLVLSETSSTTLLVLTAALGARSLQGAAPLRSLAAGVAAGAAVLVRPSGLLLVPAAAALAWWYGRRPEVSRNLLMTAVGFLLVLTPWWIRNGIVYRTVVLSTLNVGESLYDGLRPDATGASDMRFLDAARRDAGYRTMSEVERDRHWRRQALEWASRQPAAVLQLALWKLGRFWSPWPNEARFRQPLVVMVTTLGTVPVWLAAALGAWRCRQAPAVLLLCLVPAVYFCGLHSVFASSVRYRVPVEPFLRILAGIGVASLWHRSARKPSLPPP